MDYLRLDDYKEETQKKKLNKKRTIITIVTILLIILIIIIAALYITNETFRYQFDKYILRKEISEENVVSISLNTEDNSKVYAYDKYLVTLNKNILTTYSASGKEEYKNEITISNPLFSASGSYLAIGESGGQKIYLVSGANSLWQKDIEGSISKININKNGYIAVTVDNTIVILIAPNGKELFKTYLSSTTTSKVSISNNNKYLAIAEIDTSGAIIKTNIKIISVEKAQNDPLNSIIYTHSTDTNNLITNIKYQDKDKLICMYDNKVQSIQNENIEDLVNIENTKIRFVDINLENYITAIEEKSTGLFNAESEVKIINIQTKKENTYTLNSVVKNVYTYNNTIALNLGAEVHFISTNGWLIKRYISSQEISKIVLGNSIAGIVYTNKIEIINI